MHLEVLGLEEVTLAVEVVVAAVTIMAVVGPAPEDQ
jgi:hypothetical protein